MRLRGLGVSFTGAPGPASAGIDLDLRAGRVLALVGESGSGKSVTALGALGLLPPTARVTGSARLDGVELVGAPRQVLDDVRGRLAGTVFQEPTTALNPLETIAFQIGEAVRAHPGEGARAPRDRQAPRARGSLRGWRRRGGARVRGRVLELLERVGLGAGEDLERIADSYPHQLSGGQLQRACIALALACDPPVLIADEPTTALDVTVQAGILDLLRSLTEEGLAVLLITHDMAVVADIADEVAVMRSGGIVERGPVAQIFSHPRHSYTRGLLAAVPRLDSLRQEEPPEAVAGAGAAAPAGPGAAAGTAGTAGTTGSRAGGAQGAEGAGAQEPAVVIRDLEVVYGGGRRPVRAVQGVSLSIAPGEVLGMVGESGSGKSTIAGTLTGLVPISSGSVRVCGVEVAGARRRDLLPVRRSTGVVYQNPASSLNPRRTVGASIAEPLVVHGRADAAARQARVRELLEAVRLPAAMAQRYPHEMSGGQRQRVAIARALALEPRLVIADEPTSALDVSVQAVVLDLLGSLQAELGFACLFVSHDLAVVDSIASRTVVLSGGRLVEEGPTRQVLAAPRQDYTRRLVAAVPVPDPALQAARRRRRRRSRAA
nr:ABC transporter ATP-binding protein [Actinomyces bowdenii]